MRTVFFFSVSLFISFNNLAQSANYEWINSIGGPGIDLAKDITIDNDNNVIVVGNFTDSVDFEPEQEQNILLSLGTINVFIAKYDDLGELIWVKSIGSDIESCYAESVSIDDDNNIVVTGIYEGVVDFDPNEDEYFIDSGIWSERFTLKLNEEGEFNWVNSVGSYWEDQPDQEGLVYDNNIYIADDFIGLVDFDPGADNYVFDAPYNNRHIYIQKTDENGDFVWAKIIGNAWSNIHIKTSAINEEGIILCGGFNGLIDFDPNSDTLLISSEAYYNHDCFILKLDHSGNLLWFKHLPNGFDAETRFFTFCTSDSNNDIILGGVFDGLLDFDPGPETYYLNGDAYGVAEKNFLLKLDSEGEFAWAKMQGGYYHDNDINDALTNAIDDIFIVGSFIDTVDFDPGFNSFDLTSSGSTDIFVQVLNSDGNFQYAFSIGGDNLESGISLTLDDLLNLYLIGNYYLNSNLSPNETPYLVEANGEKDFFIEKLSIDLTSNISSNERQSKELKLFPNPNNGRLIIENPCMASTAINVYTLNGRKVYSQLGISEKRFEIDLALNPGYYILELLSEDCFFRTKVSIIK